MKTSPDYSWRILVFIVGLLLGIFVFTIEAQDASTYITICQATPDQILIQADPEVEHVFIWQNDELILRWFTSDSGFSQTVQLDTEADVTIQVRLNNSAETSFGIDSHNDCAATAAQNAERIRSVIPFELMRNWWPSDED